MLADILKQIHATEDQAEKIITEANLKAHEIEKETYQRITKIQNNNSAEIAAAVAKLPALTPLPAPTVTLHVPQTKMDRAVAHIVQAVCEA